MLRIMDVKVKTEEELVKEGLLLLRVKTRQRWRLSRDL